ncbi:MAG: TRAM domain-containing protein, partial [Holophagales bacterium]|nr:TRAM domain-containing protein [Holophagales bacterium]
ERLRAARPDVAITTDLIVAFPGETRAEFAETLAVVREVGFVDAYAFKYSPRPGTAAPRLREKEVATTEADRRLQELFALQGQVQQQLNRSLEGRTYEVLVSQWGKRPGTQTGRTPCHRLIHFEYGDSPLELGSLTRVEVEKGLPHSLVGRLVA